MANKQSLADIPDGISVPDIQDEIKNRLSPIELEMYAEWRNGFIEWMATEAKSELFSEGYANKEIRTRTYRIDDFAAWVFSEYGFTTKFEPQMADAYWSKVLHPDPNTSIETNVKESHAVKSALRYCGTDEDWKMPRHDEIYERVNKRKSTGFTDWLSVSELQAIKHAALRVYAVPDQESMTADEYDEWASHLAQRLRKPKHELDESDWETANSYKIPSLVWVSCDVGFRPDEIENAPVSWFSTLDDGFMSVPKEESSKNSDNWRCYLSPESQNLMQKWLNERAENPMYEDRDAVWLTREGNPYSAESLRRPIMHNLMDEAGISRSDRESGWYMVRRGVGTDIGTTEGINKVMQQLRIKRYETAARYIRHDERAMREYFENR